MSDKKVESDSKYKNHCAIIEPDSIANNSTTISDSTSFFTDSVTSSNDHLKYCHYEKSGQCICPTLVKYAKARENRKKRDAERMKKRGYNSSSSDEDDRNYNKACKATVQSLNSFRSLDSSDPSFYTAEVGSSKPPSPLLSSAFKEPFNSDLSAGVNEQTFNVNYNESNDQSMIHQMENGLFSHLSNAENSTVAEKIKPFFTRLSIVAQEKSNDDEFKECLTEAYQACQQDPNEFASKLTTILEESILSQDNFSIQFFHNVFTKFKHVEIQNESLPKSFIDKTISPTISQSPPKKKLYPSTPKTTKIVNKSQASPLFVSTVTRFIEAANQIIAHPDISALKSSSSLLVDSMSKHNDSSFTYLEKIYVGECPVSQSSAPKLTDKEQEALLLCQKQLKALEDSPQVQKEASSPQKKTDCEFSPEIDSPCFTSTKVYENATNIDVNSQNNNVDDSILHEYVTQRRRCLETERMIREIRAASTQDSGIDCNLLSMLTECSDYPKFVKTNNKSNSTKKSTPLVSSSSKIKGEKLSSKVNFKPVTPRNINRISEKPGASTQSSKKKPIIKTPLSRVKVKSSGCTFNTRSPVTHAKQLNFISPHLKPFSKNRRSGSRSPSPLPPSRDKSKSQKPTPLKMPTSVPELIITPDNPQFTSSPLPTSAYKNKNIVEVIESPISTVLSGGKYFTNPGKTPAAKNKPKKTFFRVPTPLREKIFNIDNVRSPVRDYINGNEMVVIKHVHRQENSENKKFEQKKLVNKENSPVGELNIHEVHLPLSKVHNITPITKKHFGVKKKLQKGESNQAVENKVGHANPTVIEDVVVDYSIHFTSIAQKKAFHLQSKD